MSIATAELVVVFTSFSSLPQAGLLSITYPELIVTLVKTKANFILILTGLFKQHSEWVKVHQTYSVWISALRGIEIGGQNSSFQLVIL